MAVGGYLRAPSAAPQRPRRRAGRGTGRRPRSATTCRAVSRSTGPIQAAAGPLRAGASNRHRPACASGTGGRDRQRHLGLQSCKGVHRQALGRLPHRAHVGRSVLDPVDVLRERGELEGDLRLGCAVGRSRQGKLGTRLLELTDEGQQLDPRQAHGRCRGCRREPVDHRGNLPRYGTAGSFAELLPFSMAEPAVRLERSPDTRRNGGDPDRDPDERRERGDHDRAEGCVHAVPDPRDRQRRPEERRDHTTRDDRPVERAGKDPRKRHGSLGQGVEVAVRHPAVGLGHLDRTVGPVAPLLPRACVAPHVRRSRPARGARTRRAPHARLPGSTSRGRRRGRRRWRGSARASGRPDGTCPPRSAGRRSIDAARPGCGRHASLADQSPPIRPRCGRRGSGSARHRPCSTRGSRPSTSS